MVNPTDSTEAKFNCEMYQFYWVAKVEERVM